MNITELARKLKVPTQMVRTALPELGIGIGQRAIKIPDKQAKIVVRKWPEYIAKLKKEEAEEKEAEKKLLIDVKKERIKKEIILPAHLTVRQLATELDLPIVEIIQKFIDDGMIVTINKEIDYDLAAIVAEELGFITKRIDLALEEQGKLESSRQQLKEILTKEKDNKNVDIRPPIIVVLGHVDHGKTTLLDNIKQSHIAEHEAGAITQHIGAYQIEQKDKILTFIDTPGHEAFRSMRARGGQTADLAILVVAADDQVQPQTLEAIKIIQQEKLPFLVAINKIDQSVANIEKIKQGLSKAGLVPEDWGGDVLCYPISAKTGKGVDDLLDMLILLAEENRSKLLVNSHRPAIGTVIESYINPQEGVVINAIIYTGTLEIGDWGQAGESVGRVRVLKDWQGKKIKQAIPGMPVKILGFKQNAQVGDIFQVITDKQLIKQQSKKTKGKHQRRTFVDTLTNRQSSEGNQKNLNIILKIDSLGSLEAINEALQRLKHPDINLTLIKKGLGKIAEPDILLAETSQAIVIGFNVVISPNVQALAKEKGIEIKTYQIIYHLLEGIREKMIAVLGRKTVIEQLGKVKVLAIFQKKDNSMVVGGKVSTGKISVGNKIKVYRNKELITQGQLEELQINKQKLREAIAGSECGIKFVGSTIIEVGDILEVYQEKEIDRKTDF